MTRATRIELSEKEVGEINRFGASVIAALKPHGAVVEKTPGELNNEEVNEINAFGRRVRRAFEKAGN